MPLISLVVVTMKLKCHFVIFQIIALAVIASLLCKSNDEKPQVIDLNTLKHEAAKVHKTSSRSYLGIGLLYFTFHISVIHSTIFLFSLDKFELFNFQPKICYAIADSQFFMTS